MAIGQLVNPLLHDYRQTTTSSHYWGLGWCDSRRFRPLINMALLAICFPGPSWFLKHTHTVGTLT